MSKILIAEVIIYTYPLLVKGAAAKVPPNNRKIRKATVFGERAHPICVPIKSGIEMREMSLRP